MTDDFCCPYFLIGAQPAAGAAYRSGLAGLDWYRGGEYVITDQAAVNTLCQRSPHDRHERLASGGLAWANNLGLAYLVDPVPLFFRLWDTSRSAGPNPTIPSQPRRARSRTPACKASYPPVLMALTCAADCP